MPIFWKSVSRLFFIKIYGIQKSDIKHIFAHLVEHTAISVEFRFNKAISQSLRAILHASQKSPFFLVKRFLFLHFRAFWLYLSKCVFHRRRAQMRSLNYLLIALLIIVTNLSAQWSSDSLQNTPIIVYSGDQVVPKIKATSDGGCYIAWYDNRNGNYDMYLQRLNAQGEKMWAQDGLLISDHPQDSWVTDYDLAVDAQDNAILVFNDLRNGDDNGWDVFAYKISPDGDFLWGPDGVGLSPAVNSEGEMSPKVVVTSEGNYVFAWTRSGSNDEVALQKLSSDGTKLWGNDGLTILGQQGGDASHPLLVAAKNDSVIVLWKNMIGSYPATKTILVTQKISPNGTFAWDANGVVVYNNGDIPTYYDPVMCSDDNSGAFVAWEEQPTTNESYVEIGHLNADGSLGYPLNGIKTAATSSRKHWKPSITFNPTENALFCYWIDTDISQNQYGIYGQKLDLAGNLFWGSDGKTFIPLGGRTISFVRTAGTDTSVYVGYFQSSAPNAYDEAVTCFLADVDGNFIWNPVILSAASLGEKDDLVLTLNDRAQALFAWTDSRNDSGDIFAQNINADGTLGLLAAKLSETSDLRPTDFLLGQNYPNPFNPTTQIDYQVPATGHGALRVQLNVFDLQGRMVAKIRDAYQQPGHYRVTFRRGDLPSGVYLYRLQVGKVSLTRKMVLLK